MLRGLGFQGCRTLSSGINAVVSNEYIIGLHAATIAFCNRYTIVVSIRFPRLRGSWYCKTCPFCWGHGISHIFSNRCWYYYNQTSGRALQIPVEHLYQWCSYFLRCLSIAIGWATEAFSALLHRIYLLLWRSTYTNRFDNCPLLIIPCPSSRVESVLSMYLTPNDQRATWASSLYASRREIVIEFPSHSL